MSRTRGSYKVDRGHRAIMTNGEVLAELHAAGQVLRVDVGALSLDVSPAGAGRWHVHSRTVPEHRLRNLAALHVVRKGAE